MKKLLWDILGSMLIFGGLLVLACGVVVAAVVLDRVPKEAERAPVEQQACPALLRPLAPGVAAEEFVPWENSITVAPELTKATSVTVGPVTIDCGTGEVTIQEGLTVSAAAAEFWAAVEEHIKANAKSIMRFRLWEEIIDDAWESGGKRAQKSQPKDVQ